jgi:hypothetical protein
MCSSAEETINHSFSECTITREIRKYIYDEVQRSKPLCMRHREGDKELILDTHENMDWRSLKVVI